MDEKTHSPIERCLGKIVTGELKSMNHRIIQKQTVEKWKILFVFFVIVVVIKSIEQIHKKYERSNVRNAHTMVAFIKKVNESNRMEHVTNVSATKN